MPQFPLVGGYVIFVILGYFEEHNEIDKILLSTAEHFKRRELCVIYKVEKIVPGGKTGQESIYHGLLAAYEIGQESATVLIHDGVRPLINEEIITNCIETVRTEGNAITVAPAIETIIKVDEEKRIEDVIERSRCLMARAPQCFLLKDILAAHEKANAEGRHDFIDSATMMKF